MDREQRDLLDHLEAFDGGGVSGVELLGAISAQVENQFPEGGWECLNCGYVGRITADEFATGCNECGELAWTREAADD